MDASHVYCVSSFPSGMEDGINWTMFGYCTKKYSDSLDKGDAHLVSNCSHFVNMT